MMRHTAHAAPLSVQAGGAAQPQGEDDGWLLLPLHNSKLQRMQVAVLDAAALGRGPVAVITLPHHLPHASGAAWADAYLGPGRTAPVGWVPRRPTA